jgi:hypothetical protein
MRNGANTGPYTNFLSMSAACQQELRRILRDDDQLAGYADRVQLVTDNSRQKATSDQDYHCLCIIRLPTEWIVLDPVAYRGAIRVPLATISTRIGNRQ